MTNILSPYDILLTKPVRMILPAKTGSGKSYLLLDWVYTNRKFFYDVWVFAGSEDVFATYVDIIPKSRLIDGWNEAKFEEVWNTVGQVFADCTAQGLPFRQTLIILDDQSFDSTIFKSKLMIKAFCNGRHRKCSLVIANQYVKQLPLTVRTQAQLIMALRETSRTVMSLLHTEWFGIMEPKMFRKLFMQATENYGALVSDTTSKSAIINKSIFTYRAKKTPPSHDPITKKRMWHLCHRRVWRLDLASRNAKKLAHITKAQAREEIIAKGGMVLSFET